MGISDWIDPDQQLKRSSVVAVVLLSFVTLGFYYPIWFLRRRRGLNSLDSRRKLGILGPVILLALHAIYLVLPQHSTPEKIAGLAVLPTFLVLAFRVRFILADHLTSKTGAVLPVSLSFQTASNPSNLLTFFLTIWYLQYKINQLIDESRAWTHAGTVGEDPETAAATSITHAGNASSRTLAMESSELRPGRLALSEAVAVHALMLPWWVLIAAVFAMAPVARFLAGSTAQTPPVTALEIAVGFAIFGVVVGIWIWLLTRIVVWWRQGRRRLWLYPLMWALALAFTFLAMLALLLPSFRRSLTPRPVGES